MSKTLKVIDPFFDLELGDILELSEDGKSYSIERTEKHSEINADGADMSSSYTSKFTISTDYAKQLIKDELLSETSNKHSDFVNIFDEIDNLIKQYTIELGKLDDLYEKSPLCLKVEKQTVLNNLLIVLNHLKNLKK